MRTVTVAILALIGVPLAAQTSNDPSTVPGQIAKTGEAGKKVCRTEVALGSNMPRRVCMTAAEAKAQAKANEQSNEAYINEKNSSAGRRQ